MVTGAGRQEMEVNLKDDKTHMTLKKTRSYLTVAITPILFPSLPPSLSLKTEKKNDSTIGRLYKR